MRVHLVCGEGGTGKTTMSASLALALAEEGRRVGLLTIDPAQRLASTLGVGLGDTFRPVVGAPSLQAAMLDADASWAARIDASFGARAAAVRTHDLVRLLGTRMGGAAEYLAVWRLIDLVRDGAFEDLVVDTPPGRHAIDILMAPRRLAQAVGTQRRGLPGVGLGLDVLRRVGGPAIGRIAEFFDAVRELHGGFREVADEGEALWRSGRCEVVVVVRAGDGDEDERSRLLVEVRRAGPRFAGFVVNRVAPPWPSRLPPRPECPRGWDEDAWRTAWSGVESHHRVGLERHVADLAAARRLGLRHGGVAVVHVTEGPVDGLDRLREIGRGLRSGLWPGPGVPIRR